MIISVADATGSALDWMVAKARGRRLVRRPMGLQRGHGWWIWEEVPSGRGGIILSQSVYMEIGPYVKDRTRTTGDRYSPSTDWSQAGPLLSLKKIDLHHHEGTVSASIWRGIDGGGELLHSVKNCPTDLVAICRCFVISELGPAVDVPEELVS